MKRICTLWVVLLTSAGWVYAEPQIHVTLQSDTPAPYLHQAFNLMLTLEWSEVDLAQDKIEIMGMPDRAVLSLGNVQEMPADQVDENGISFQRRRFVWKAHANAPGTIHLAPTLRVAILTRQRSFIGFSTFYSFNDVTVTPTDIPIRDLPTHDPTLAFSGAVGQFELAVTPSITNLSVGDLIDLHLDIRGQGFLEGITAPILAASENVKVYAPKAVDTTEGASFVQTVVPQRAVPEIGRLSFCYFDPQIDQYVTKEAGPFALSYHERTTEHATQYMPHAAPIAQSDATPSTPAENKPLNSQETTLTTAESARLAPTVSSMVLFEVPAHSPIHLIRSASSWVMIESQDRRGWIPATAVGK